MKYFLVTLFCFFALIFNSFAQVNDISIETFKKVVESNPGVQVLDVRTRGEAELGIVNGAIVCDITQPEFRKMLAQLDKSKPIYVYCEAGGRSLRAAQIMLVMGFSNVYNVTGGMAKWRDKKYPISIPSGTIQ